MDSFTRLFRPDRQSCILERPIRLIVLANLPRARLAGLLNAGLDTVRKRYRGAKNLACC